MLFVENTSAQNAFMKCAYVLKNSPTKSALKLDCHDFIIFSWPVIF
jgi:hypothetical protein